MVIRLIAAALICLAPLKVSAGSNPAELAREASTLARLAVAEEDPEAAVVGAFEAHNLWSLAFQIDGNELHLCKARSLLAKVCARSDLDTEHRDALEASRKALPQCPKSGPPQKRLKRIGRPVAPPEFLDVPGPAEQVAPPVEPPAPEAASPAPEAASHGAEDNIQLLDAPETLDQAPHGVRALKLSGAISMAFGLVALGVMAPFAVRDAAYAREYSSLAAKSQASGGLTLEEDQRVAELDQSSRSTFRSSLALGVTGGLATMLGGSLLIVGHRRALSVAPHADRDSVSVSLQGRF